MADLRKLPEHTVDVELLPESPVVLDVGCRDFEFDLKILELRPSAHILAFDPDPEIVAPKEFYSGYKSVFFNAAVTYQDVQDVLWQGSNDGSFIVGDSSGLRWDSFDQSKTFKVQNTTVTRLMENFLIEHFDLVKLDCEGSEFGILENWPGPIATQISVEFHDFFDRKRWDDAYFKRLFDGPLRDYKPVLFGLSTVGPGSVGHWDCLLVQR